MEGFDWCFGMTDCHIPLRFIRNDALIDFLDSLIPPTTILPKKITQKLG